MRDEIIEAMLEAYLGKYRDLGRSDFDEEEWREELRCMKAALDALSACLKAHGVKAVKREQPSEIHRAGAHTFQAVWDRAPDVLAPRQQDGEPEPTGRKP